jgi:uncharacterized protein YggE
MARSTSSNLRIANLALALVLPAASWAQIPTRPASITAVGSASVSVTPDLARVDISVVTQGATAQDATVANATQATAVISALQSFVSSSSNIKTVSYYLSPVYNNPPPGQSATIIGYMVTNTVEVTLTDLTQVGKVIDTAIQSGANRVQGVSFDLQDRNPVVAQALKTAAGRARSQADAIAAGLNVHTGMVLHAIEGVNAVTPLALGAAAAAAPTTPIETGLVVVQASVTVEVAINP